MLCRVKKFCLLLIKVISSKLPGETENITEYLTFRISDVPAKIRTQVHPQYTPRTSLLQYPARVIRKKNILRLRTFFHKKHVFYPRTEVKIVQNAVTDVPPTHNSSRFNLWHLQVNHKIMQKRVFRNKKNLPNRLPGFFSIFAVVKTSWFVVVSVVSAYCRHVLTKYGNNWKGKGFSNIWISTEGWRKKIRNCVDLPYIWVTTQNTETYITISHLTLISVTICTFYIQFSPVITTLVYATPRL